ncbi:MAG: Rid family detoxifying hydrolase [Deltaproteobacteria bacterium]|nr:Rid family detoxifying hydrolase [Deltaproteobacteria bacterium]MCL5791838.1 Rid family detoxifying hydrolase [Deltaproteobacteria bacterium]
MKTIITTDKLPLPQGHYSQMIIAGGFLFLSGQIAIDPLTSNLIEGDVNIQTEFILNAIKSVMNEQGLGLKNIIKISAYLVEADDFQSFNEVYSKHFLNEEPVRTTVFVNALPKGAKVELDVVAVV